MGVAVLTLLYGVAIFAPLLANDRPFVIESVDVKQYAGGVRVLSPMVLSAGKVAEQTDEEFQAILDAKTSIEPGAPTNRVECDGRRARGGEAPRRADEVHAVRGGRGGPSTNI